MDAVFNAVAGCVAELPSQVGRDVGQRSGLYTHRSYAVGDTADDEIVEILVGIGTASDVVGGNGYVAGGAGVSIQHGDHIELVIGTNEGDGVDGLEAGGETGIGIVDSTDDKAIVAGVAVPLVEGNHERIQRHTHLRQSGDADALEVEAVLRRGSVTEVGVVEHVRHLVAGTFGQQSGSPAVGNNVGGVVAGAEDVLEVLDIRQIGDGTATGDEVAHLRSNGSVASAEGIDIHLVAGAVVETSERDAGSSRGNGGTGAGSEATVTIFNQIASGKSTAGPADSGGVGCYVAGNHIGGIGTVGDVFHHDVVEEAVVVVEGIPESEMAGGVADTIKRIDDIGVGRGVVVGADERVDRMDGGNGSCGIVHNTHDETHIVATLYKVETDLQLVERSIHFGQDDISAVVEKEQLVGVAFEVDDNGVGIRRAEVGAAGVPALAAIETVLVLEVLGVGQFHRTAGGRGLCGAGEDHTRAVEADAYGVVAASQKTSEAVAARGDVGVGNDPASTLEHVFDSVYCTRFAVPHQIDLMRCGSGNHYHRCVTCGDVTGGRVQLDLVDVANDTGVAGTGRSRINVGTILIEIDGTVACRSSGIRDAAHPNACIIVHCHNQIAAGSADKESVEVQCNPASAAKRTSVDKREAVDRDIVAGAGE